MEPMTEIPADLNHRLREHDQLHLLWGWEGLSAADRTAFVHDLRKLDLEQLKLEHARIGMRGRIPPIDRIDIIPKAKSSDDAEARRLGEEALARGEIAVVLVAGGRGSRLGFEHPKGMFGIGPVSGKSLFAFHAEKILARRRRHGGRIPLLIMTSDATHDETETYFEEQRYFGLPSEDVRFFRQGTMPVLASDRFRLLLEAPGRLCRSPNGHGGTLLALHESGLLDEMHDRGVRHLFYFQVDNPLVKVADPLFLGQHLLAKSEASSKIVPKAKPTDKIGNLVLVDGRCTIVEYHEPDENEMFAEKSGRHLFLDGSPAIHVFEVEFFQRLLREGFALPLHFAKRKVDHLDEAGRLVRATSANAVQLETFIFDTLPQAKRWLAVETTHEEEFAPLKNGDNDPTDNPTTVRRAISSLAADWLRRAGVKLPDVDRYPVEISPLFALDPEDVARRLQGDLTIRGSVYFAE
jgi:UDP-N-acetylglucosamine/UDP-N-acetylgalactosamine diphosphorylase